MMTQPLYWIRRTDGRTWHIADELLYQRGEVLVRCGQHLSVNEIAGPSRIDETGKNPPRGRLCNGCIGLLTRKTPAIGEMRELAREAF